MQAVHNQYSSCLREAIAQPVSRRHFPALLIAAMWSFMGAVLSIPAALYVLMPPKSKAQGTWTKAGDITGLPLHVPQEVVFERERVDGWKTVTEKASAWVVKKSDDQVTAFVPLCTHLGCAVRWEQDRKSFLCPCHVSLFDIEGRVLNGPAPRPLDRYDVKVAGGTLMVGPVRNS